MLLVIGLGWGGYVAYRQFAPYYGLGYATGRTGTVSDVTFTVADARCGLDQPPDKPARSVKGQFCLVDLGAKNTSDKVRFVSLSMFSVQLDTGSRVSPSRTAMSSLSVRLNPGESHNLVLVYDVWSGVRMDNLKVQIGYETANIPLI
ncbi:MAG: DUF4352 domain-containing protein [Micromonosporaceae bacterium]